MEYYRSQLTGVVITYLQFSAQEPLPHETPFSLACCGATTPKSICTQMLIFMSENDRFLPSLIVMKDALMLYFVYFLIFSFKITFEVYLQLVLNNNRTFRLFRFNSQQ